PARGEQHRVSLADAGRSAEEDLQPAAFAPGFLALDSREQVIRAGALFWHDGRKYRAVTKRKSRGRAGLGPRKTWVRPPATSQRGGDPSPPGGATRSSASRCSWMMMCWLADICANTELDFEKGAGSRIRGDTGYRGSAQPIQGEIEREHVDARLAEEAELPALGRPGDERANLLRIEAACFCDAR